MIARFQTYGSVLRFVSFIGDIDHIIKINEIPGKGWEVQHQPVRAQHILWAHDPAKALSEEEAAALRKVWDGIHETFAVPAHLISSGPMRPYEYTRSYAVHVNPGRDA